MSKSGHANIKDFPKDFDIKENLGEDLNDCDRCGDIQNTWHEMYWQGEECQKTNEILGDYTAVCDDCYMELKQKEDK